jgi:hypothetical protein
MVGDEIVTLPLLSGLCFRLCRRIEFTIWVGGGGGASVRETSPELQCFRPYILVLPPGGEVDFVDFRIAGVNSSVSAAITLHSGDEWVFCVPRHQQYWSGRWVNFYLSRSDSSSEVVSSSDFRFDRFDFYSDLNDFFSVFSLSLVERGGQ